MIHFMTLLATIEYFMFLKESLTNTENIQCSAFLSSTVSTLNCESEMSFKIFMMKRNTNRESITINALSSIKETFFNVKNSMELDAYQCDNEIMLVKRTQADIVLQNNCSKSIISISEFQRLPNALNLTKLEVTNFLRPIIQLEESTAILKLNIHDNIFGAVVSNSTLSFPSSLTHLSITNSDIQVLSDDLFSELSSLTELDLSGNKLKEIYVETFEKLTSLKKLDLSNNSLQISLFEAVKYLPELEIMNISGNFFKHRWNPFEYHGLNLYKLKYLYFSNCRLERLDYFLFRFMGDLRYLDLSRNEIYIVETKSFLGKVELEYLNLSKNMIDFLHNDTFALLRKLEFLDLSNNRLISINQFHFRYLTSLKFLNISFNQITSLNQEVFQILYNLTVINIKNNAIEYFDFSILKNQKKLSSLDASQNNILRVSNTEKIDINVENQDFSQNNIISFSSIQHFLPHLKSLKLDHNKINNSNFLQEVSCIPDLSHSIFLSLTHNSFSNFYVSKCKDEENYFWSNNNTDCLSNNAFPFYVDISFNPFKCDCKLYPLYRYIKECPNKFHFSNLNNIKCHSPYFLEKNVLKSVPDETFSCLFTKNCPVYEVKNISSIRRASCNCGIRAKDSKTFVNCSNLNLAKVIEKAPIGTTILFFQQNKLTDLSSLNSEVWMNLTDIIVDDNDIGTLKEWILPPNLSYLSLRGNRLKILSEDLMEFIPTQNHFDLFLGRNDRNCDCESKILKEFLISKPEFVKDIEDIICDYEEQGIKFSEQLILIPENILCAEQFAYYFAQTVLISSFSTLILVLVAAIIAYIRMRMVIHSFLYSHCNKLFCFKSYDIDSEGKIFDAFIAYSSYDRQIVFKLLDELESKQPHFRLCIHERDWVPGQFIYDNINNSVQNSKRIIIVMSDHFIASPWFKVELNAAISKDKMNPFIVILVEKSINLNKISKHFRHVISKKTYLVWGERWFWEKLRYAMPHKKSDCLETYV